MTGVLIDNISIILQVKPSQLDTFKRSKIQLSKQKYNLCATGAQTRFLATVNSNAM